MPALAVLSRTLRLPGGDKVYGPERRVEVTLPRGGDVVQALLASVEDAKRSRVEISVADVRLLRADEALRGVAALHAFWSDDWLDDADEASPPGAGPERRAGKAARRADNVKPERMLRLAAVPNAQGCVPARGLWCSGSPLPARR